MTSEGILVSSNEQKNHPSDQEIHDILAILDDLMLNESHNRNMHLEKLDKALQKCGPSSIFKLMQKYSHPEVKPVLLRRLRALATMSVKEGSVNAIDMFNVEEEGLNENHVVDILSDAFGNLPTDILNKVLCDIIIPEMFNNCNFSKKVHYIIIDVGFRLIEKFPITNLSYQDIKLFTTKVIEKYSKILESLREQNYNRWHDLWIFFVRFSAKHLHVSMDLANKLLRVVEYAFRNPSYEQRLKGYDCWKELIDNASLDMNHLCSNKQIKLLVTPLRAKFSKMEIVICKRFEVFLYLLEKLQKQSVLCLNEFLEFCFGVSNNVNNCSKNGQGKLVPNLWLKSIQVFLAILGDQTYISATLNRALFEEPVIDANNINKFGYVTVCAVIECSIILKQISIESQEKISILTSLWEALFDIIVKTSTEMQEKCFQTIFDSLNTLFKVYNEDVVYIGLYVAFSHLLESSIDQRLISDSLKLLLEYSLKFLGDVDVSHEFSEQLCELIQFVSKEVHMIDFLLEQFKKLETSRNESKLYTIWNILGTKLITELNIASHFNMIIHFFLWPVHHLQNLGQQTSVDTCSTWLRLFMKASQLSDTIKTAVLDEYGKCLKSNPLLSDNVATLISVLAQSKMDFSKEFVDKILKIIFAIMSLPLLPQETSVKMYDLVLKCTNTVATFSADDVGSEMVNNLRQCIEKIRSHQKNPRLVEVLENILSRKIIRQPTATLDKRRKSLHAMVSPQDSSSGTPTGNIKRSLRMTQMAFEKESANADNKDKVNSLKFFGKDIETMTPLKVKGSVLQNLKNMTPNSRSKKIINSVKKSLVPEPPFIEDHSSDYVLINSEVKLQKDKLTEHQLEEMKRRREDIPALYQDLSQSQTQSTCSNSRDIVSIPAEAKHDESGKDVMYEEHLDTEVSRINFGYYAKSIDGINSPTEGNSAASTEIEEIFLNSSTSSGNKKKNKTVTSIEKELRKIQMNIVGGDTFFDNLPSKRTRKVITPIPTKKQKKSEQESKINEENDVVETDNQILENERIKIMKQKSDTCEESHTQVEKIDTTSKKEVFANIEKTPGDLLEKGVDEHINSSPHSNSRKNKFIKPKKLIVTPKSEKKKTNSEITRTFSSKKKMQSKMKTKKLEFESKDCIDKSTAKKNKPDEIQSEILFESEIDTEMKKTDKVKNVKATNKREEDCLSSCRARQTDSVNEVGSSSKQEKESDEQKNNIEKYKKRPKEIMKKNKEKVRKIQRQLRLATLSDLTDSSESKNTKGDKLLFIREITKSKHVENTKLAPAGLKRNKDNKSSSIAYSIEPPNSSFDLVSLNLDVVQTSTKKSTSIDEVLSDTDLKKPGQKRKRTNSLNSISGLLSASESSSIENKQKMHKKVKLKRSSIEVKGVISIESSSSEDSPILKESELDIKKSSPSKIKTKVMTNPKSDSVESKKISTKKNSPFKKNVSSPSLENPSRITRSKSSSLSPMDQADWNSCKLKNNVIDEPTKAVVKLLFQGSEDIIESSQDSLLETTTGNLSKSRNKLSPKTRGIPLREESEEDNVIDEDKERKESVEDANREVSAEVEMLNNGEGSVSFREKTKSVISQADTLTCDSNVEPQPIVLDLDLPEKPELTESEKVLSTADTVSIVSQISEEEVIIGSISVVDADRNEKTLDNVEKINTVEKTLKPNDEGNTEKDFEVVTPRTQRSRDLPGSPVSNVTPTLTRELLDNTMDISPISSQLSLEGEKSRENEIEKHLDEVIGQTVEIRTESRLPNDCKSDDKAQMSLNMRSDRLLNMVNVASPVSHKKISKKNASSPALVNSRYEKLFSFFNGNKEDEGRTNKKKDDFGDITENIEDVLTFSREVPSPYALPSSGILKRKLTDMDEGFSPCAKRKRVNFSYPCISSTKLYIRHKEELNSYCPPLLAQKLFGDDYEDEDDADDDPFAYPKAECIETEESVNITNPLMLCRKKPIYEQLVNCTENIDRLWKRLSSPTYSELLQKLLFSKKIHTIGNLASLSEVQINRLPFKQPRIKTVRKALNFYFTNVYKKTIEVSDACTSAESQNDNPTVLEAPENMLEETSETNGQLISEDNLREEFVSVLTKIKNQKIPLEEFGATFLDLVEESELIDVLKSVYNTDFRKFFKKCHCRYLIETIVQYGETTEMFDTISDLAKSNEMLASGLESVVQMRISQSPLKDIISQRPLPELRDSIEDCINRDVFKRQEVTQMCLVPLIKSPSDIKCYFNNLTIVQVHELFIERVQPSDLSLFLEQIKEHYGNYTVAQCANRSDVLKLCSKEELMTSLIEKKSEVVSVIELISKITDQNKLLTLYDYIGTRISKESRREKFIEFLNSIPLDSNNDESRIH